MADPSLSAELRVECRPTNPPQPISIAVVQGDRVTAVLTYDQLKAAMERFDDLRNTADTLRRARFLGWSG